MAGEEEVELRDLVAHTLETRGVLGKIRAQLRASVFLALEEQESREQKQHPLVSSKFQQYLKTKDGQVATALVREFLSYFELDYTCSVFDPETNALETYPGRDKLANDLDLNDTSTSGPLISQLLHRALSNAQPPSSASNPPPSTSNAPPSTSNPPPSASVLPLSTAAAPLDTVSTPSLRTPLDGDRQPVSKHPGTTSFPPSTHTHQESHDSVLQSGENDFMKPTNSLDKGGASGGVTSVSGGSATSGNREGGGSGPPQATSGNGHNLNGSASLTPHLGLPSTNGIADVGDSATRFQSTTGTTLSDGQHHVGFTEEIEEDIAISENRSNSEESTDDFFGTKSSRGGSKAEFSYEDDFHSDISKSGSNNKLQVAARNKYEETEDYTFSESSFGTDVDFVEPAKT